jgi:hypothetical protein
MALFQDRPDFPSGLRVLLISGEDGARQRMAAQLEELSYKGDINTLISGVQYAARGPSSGSKAALARQPCVRDRSRGC